MSTPQRRETTTALAATPTVGHVGELALIRAVTSQLRPGPHTRLGPGDDASVLQVGDQTLVVSTDLMVEGHDFRLDWSTPAQIGRKAFTQNAADVVAMGAHPITFVVGCVGGGELPVQWWVDLMAGFQEGAQEVQADVCGGDMSDGPCVMVSVTAIGVVRHGNAVLRSGAEPHQAVVLRGAPGWAAAGLALLQAGILTNEDMPPVLREAAQRALQAQRAPTPDLTPIEPSTTPLTALTDVSDGLVVDAEHLASASGLTIDLDPAAIEAFAQPLAPLATHLGADAQDWVMGGGEDHTLLGIVPEGPLPAGWIRIGTTKVPSNAGHLVLIADEPWRGSRGWEHFATE